MPSTGAVPLSLAICAYDHVRALADGTVGVVGASLNVQHFDYPSEIFHRSLQYGEWDVTELSFAKYVSLTARGDDRFVAIPVFPSRSFRHGAVYVQAASTLSSLEELSGRRVGIPEWAQTAGVFVRGLMSEEHGIDLATIEWLQGGVNAPGRVESAEIDWPEGVQVTSIAGRPLAELLASGELDAIIAAAGPVARGGERSFRPLLAEAPRREREYLAKTGIFPIMHVIALKRSLHERYPWLAANLRRGFEAARSISLARLAVGHVSLYPVPQLPAVLAEAEAAMGGEVFPYGLEANRPTIEAFLRYCRSQGLTSRPVTAEELFVAAALDEFRN